MTTILTFTTDKEIVPTRTFTEVLFMKDACLCFKDGALYEKDAKHWEKVETHKRLLCSRDIFKECDKLAWFEDRNKTYKLDIQIIRPKDLIDEHWGRSPLNYARTIVRALFDDGSDKYDFGCKRQLSEVNCKVVEGSAWKTTITVFVGENIE